MTPPTDRQAVVDELRRIGDVLEDHDPGRVQFIQAAIHLLEQPPGVGEYGELEALARKATPGPWQRSGARQNISENCIMVGPDEFPIIALPVGKNPKEHAGAFNDAGYIAAASPSVILGLLTHIRQCREAARAEALEEAARQFDTTEYAWTAATIRALKEP